MTSSQLSRARDRFPTLVRLLQQRSLANAILFAGLAPNRMTISRWARGLQAPSEDQLVALAVWAQLNANLNAQALYDRSEKAWAVVLSQGGDLASLRKGLGLKQSEVAETMGVSRYTYLLAEREGGALAERARGWLESQRRETERVKK